jgi:NADPH:quinone reductase-like Zn-dependent oxidoreductase
LAEEGGIRVIKTRVRPNGGQLAEIAHMVENGSIRPQIAATFPLEHVGEAHEVSRGGGVRGKIVWVAQTDHDQALKIE